MLVLLPPSEGKTPARRGRPVDVGTLSSPQLAEARTALLDALAVVSAQPDAVRLLGVPPTLGAEVARNTAWRTAPAQPVSKLYSGVLYDALDLASLEAGPRRRAANRVLVMSAVWGVLELGDRVPAYRVDICAALPGIGKIERYWREHLPAALDARADGHLVVDCRSSEYLALWRPPDPTRWVTVRVLREVGGTRSVVSHMAKHTRGLVTRHLVARGGSDPRTPDALARALGERWPVELGPPNRDGRRVLDVVVEG